MLAAIKQWRNFRLMRFRLLLTGVLMLASVGCIDQPTERLPTALRDVSPQQLERHGNLTFVRDPRLGFELAAKHHLPCLLFFTAEWCTYCHQMEQTTFSDKRVSELADEFVCILINADRQPKICRHFEVSGFPTVQFVASDGQSLEKLVGRQSAKKLIAGMRAASERFAWLQYGASELR